MGRSILAVLVGFVVVPIVAFGCDAIFHHMRPDLMPNGVLVSTSAALIVLFYSEVANVIGGWVTGLIAPRNPVKHAMILGILGEVMVIPATILTWHKAPLWFHLGPLLLTIPVCMIGGWLAERRGSAPMPEAA